MHKYPRRAQSEAEMMRIYFPNPPESAGDHNKKKKKDNKFFEDVI